MIKVSLVLWERARVRAVLQVSLIPSSDSYPVEGEDGRIVSTKQAYALLANI
jgi:hypothetical protein